MILLGATPGETLGGRQKCQRLYQSRHWHQPEYRIRSIRYIR
jgi:hypothetical protein